MGQQISSTSFLMLQVAEKMLTMSLVLDYSRSNSQSQSRGPPRPRPPRCRCWISPCYWPCQFPLYPPPLCHWCSCCSGHCRPAHTHTQGFRLACKVWESCESPHPQPSPFQQSSSPFLSNLTPWLFPHTYSVCFLDFSFRWHIHSDSNTICMALGDDDPSTEPIHSVFIAFSNSIMEKNPESYIFPPHLFHLLPLEHQPDQSAPLSPPPRPDPPAHTPHTTPPFSKPTAPWNWTV